MYTPSGGDGRAFLNGFEIDSPSMANQISFPSPEHRFERVELEDGATTASWHAAPTNASVRYNVYLGTSPTKLTSVAEGLKETSVEFTGETFDLPVTLAQLTCVQPGLNVFDTYYWRVDVVGCKEHIGRVFTFRAAQLAFPGAEGYGYVYTVSPARIFD